MILRSLELSCESKQTEEPSSFLFFERIELRYHFSEKQRRDFNLKAE